MSEAITVKVGGISYPARLEGRILRFVENKDHFLLQEMDSIFGGKGDLTPNDMLRRYNTGEFSLLDYAEMKISMGYSISGFMDLHSFEDIAVESPEISREGRYFVERDLIPAKKLKEIVTAVTPQMGQIWRHEKKGDEYLILGFVYNTISDEVDVKYSRFDIVSGFAYPQGQEFSRQISGNKKAFLEPNEDGTPRFTRVR